MMTVYTVKVSGNGIQEWYLDNHLHRLDGPAISRPDGHQEWYQNGKLHRVDGPALISTEGYQAWWVNGVRHRDDGPAIISEEGTQQWWVNGLLHRLDGPAIIWDNGEQEWWVEGVRYDGKSQVVKGASALSALKNLTDLAETVFRAVRDRGALSECPELSELMYACLRPKLDWGYLQVELAEDCRLMAILTEEFGHGHRIWRHIANPE